MATDKIQPTEDQQEELQSLVDPVEDEAVVATAVEEVKIGKLLISLREQKGLSLDDVVADIRIRKIFLEALEEENFDQLPERTYALGYLRVYLTYLEVKDVDMYLKSMDESYHFSDPDYHNTEYASPLEEKYSFTNMLKHNIQKTIKNNADNKPSNKKKKYLPAVLFIIVVLVVGCFVFVEPTKQDADLSDMATQTNPDKIFSNSNAYITKDKPAESTPEATLQVPEPVDTPASNNQSSKTLDPNATDSVAEQELRFVNFPTETKARTIKITFLDKVWIRIYDMEDKNIVYLDKIFNPGDVYEVPGIDGLAMNLADYEKVDIMVSSTRIFLYNKKRRSHVINNITLEDKYLLAKYSNAR